jgi:hypothetical protein
MDLPDVKAGMAILAEHIQRLNAAIKQVRLRPGVGYLLKESSGGTSIVITPPQRASTGGGGGSTIPCPFEVTDASDEQGLKVQVAWGLIWQRLPTGMFPDNDPPLVMEVSANCFVYSKIIFDTETLLPTGISFSVESNLMENTDTTQYNLIATVIVDTEAEAITEIRNVCQRIWAVFAI